MAYSHWNVGRSPTILVVELILQISNCVFLGQISDFNKSFNLMGRPSYELLLVFLPMDKSHNGASLQSQISIIGHGETNVKLMKHALLAW